MSAVSAVLGLLAVLVTAVVIVVTLVAFLAVVAGAVALAEEVGHWWRNRRLTGDYDDCGHRPPALPEPPVRVDLGPAGLSDEELKRAIGNAARRARRRELREARQQEQQTRRTTRRQARSR